ncbi:MAG: hypothetical protein ACREXX_00295 [Gammaproteobacteria bacterium]
MAQRRQQSHRASGAEAKGREIVIRARVTLGALLMFLALLEGRSGGGVRDRMGPV